jgi:hypothetical protein
MGDLPDFDLPGRGQSERLPMETGLTPSRKDGTLGLEAHLGMAINQLIDLVLLTRKTCAEIPELFSCHSLASMSALLCRAMIGMIQRSGRRQTASSPEQTASICARDRSGSHSAKNINPPWGR